METALLISTEESLIFLEEKAKDILNKEVYNGNHPSEEQTHELYNAFVQSVVEVGKSVIGSLCNVSPHALFLEFGTDNEGTSEHYIPLGVNGELHWVNPITGQDMYSEEGHFVKGITPVHFLMRALTENIQVIADIYAAQLNAVIINSVII